MNDNEFQVIGQNDSALFTLKLHRGEGMTLLAMNWKKDKPSQDFVGFAIEYKEPGGDRFFTLMNRINFPDSKGKVNPTSLSSRLSPIQKFRWIHFPRNANLNGEFVYKVTPVFMNDKDELSYGEPQQAPIVLKRETYPGQLNVAFTRGFVSSQAFVDNYESAGSISELLPSQADKGLSFIPTHPKAQEAFDWMGFEARQAILDLLDEAMNKDPNAEVRVIAYDLNEPEIVSRLEKLKSRLKVIIDDEGAHGKADSAETQAAKRLQITAGNGNVKRQHMGKLQHNKTIIVNGTTVQAAIGGSTNFSWRGFFVQSNNALIVRGKSAIKPFLDAFDNFWKYDLAKDFGKTASAEWNDLGLTGIDAKIAFSPHSNNNAVLKKIADDMNSTQSNLFFSLAFLYQTEGPIKDAIANISKNDGLFVYGISDKKVGGLELQKPNGNIAPVYPAALSKNLPEPFKTEPTGGSGTRMHHKFVIIDFDKPTARVYLGSYNFSSAADTSNGENLFIIRDRKIAVAYVIEALRIFDHYHFRVAQQDAKNSKKTNPGLFLAKPPRQVGELPWWSEYYTDIRKIRDRELFS